VLGGEASLAGGSYMQPGRRGVLRFGSELVSITADATLPGGLGSFAYDDEGVPAQRTPIVERGVFVGYMTSRESAGALDLAATGAARADGWQRVPLVRMTNVSLEPSDEHGMSLKEMVANTEDGILVDMIRASASTISGSRSVSAARSAGDQARETRPNPQEPHL